MQLLHSLSVLLSAVTLTTATTQHLFSYESLPPSAYSPTALHHSVDLGGSLTRAHAVYQLEKDHGSAVKGDTFVVGVRRAAKDGGWVEASEGKGAGKKPLPLTVVGSDDTTTYYSLTLSPSSSSAPTTLTVSTVSLHQSLPDPPSLPQNAESIYMRWEGDLLSPLAGLTREQREKVREVRVKVTAPTPRIVEARAADGFEMAYSKGSATVTFTSKGRVADLSAQPAKVHYQQPQAVATIRKLDRVLELSHWGNNLAVQDNVELYNSGPLLDGHFARIDHQKATMHRRQGLLSITSLSIPLPPSAHAPYYYDAVGNVSTSRFRPSPSSSSNSGAAVLPSQKRRAAAAQPALVELQPRYPLLGGWNYTFTLGYDLALDEYIRVRPAAAGGKGRGRYVAAVPFLQPLRDVAVEEARVEIRLPEGARNLRVHAPFPVDRLAYPNSSSQSSSDDDESKDDADTLVRTYLDSTGRPTVVLEKRGCTDRHGGEVIIEYDLSLFAELLQKPLAAAAVLGGLFGAVILAKRVRWGIAA